MANEKKTSRKKFRVAVSGSTVDGREISPVHLREAAENFNPDVYAARVNVEHYLSPCPSSEFSAMGDVTALSTEDITEGPLAGRTALYAEIEPTERMKQLVADGKKIYSSIELHPQFSVIGAYVVRHNLIMPDNFGRTAATVLTEEICNPVLTQAGTDADADLSAFIEPLDTLREIVTDQDMPDEVRAKLCKACAFARRGLTDADSMASSLKLLREAMHLNPNAGVKREIATLSRALKKADSAAAPEDASTPQAQDESSKSKKTTRKPATRKTTATQKAKRG